MSAYSHKLLGTVTADGEWINGDAGEPMRVSSSGPVSGVKRKPKLPRYVLGRADGPPPCIFLEDYELPKTWKGRPFVLNDSEDDGGLVIEEPRVSSLEERKLLLKLLIAARDCSAKTSAQRAADYLSEIAFTYIVNAGGRSHWANVEEAWRQIDKREVLPEPLLHDYQLSNLEQNMKKLFRVRGPCALVWIYCVRLRDFYVCRQS
jgi:hypothetical protein